MGAHGVKGTVRIKSFTEEPANVAAYGSVSDEAGARSFTLEPIGASRGAVLARIEGVDNREAADALAGTRLYVPRSALPTTDEDEFYHADLLGLRVLSTNGEAVGTVSSILPIGETDVLEIDRESGRPSLLVPFTAEDVPEVDLAAGHIVIEVPVDAEDDDHEGDA
jgi:16S rRNA processing protein RimM